jgi:sn-glycerol 3-phosphate transport system ATP-binding protein
LEPSARDIAMVFQNYALYPHMSVFDNMAYGLKIRGMAKTEIGQRVERAAQILELDTLLERKPRQLSGGQRQRVAMGRAIVRDPAVFLFDEPLSNLDAKLRVQMRLEIQKLHRELRTTSLYVTHDQVEAMSLAHRLLVMNGGRAEQIGTPDEVYLQPATIFVAGFIGSPPMNLLRGRVSADGRTFLMADGASIALPHAFDPFAGRELILGIRPEDFIAADAAAASLQVVVETVESLGAETLAHGSFGGHAFTIRTPGRNHPAADTTLGVTFTADKLHWFDLASGRRIAPAASAASADRNPDAHSLE